ncbi:MAG: AbrB/MazE/SpoVT family DNA-binding domain-containing protein [Candidatus Aenigmarchaeota archaeon]|nr:AbrB/MazE/SpoVT family DNA-binding domain-containing protein [Candidatus Aenigmarchaeota archaeon]
MLIKRTVGEKGQVVLPKDIRDQLGIKPGSEVVFDVKDGEVNIKPNKEVSGKVFVEYFCKTSKKLKNVPTIEDLKKTLEEEYDLP